MLAYRYTPSDCAHPVRLALRVCPSCFFTKRVHGCEVRFRRGCLFLRNASIGSEPGLANQSKHRCPRRLLVPLALASTLVIPTVYSFTPSSTPTVDPSPAHDSSFSRSPGQYARDLFVPSAPFQVPLTTDESSSSSSLWVDSAANILYTSYLAGSSPFALVPESNKHALTLNLLL